MAGIWSLGAGAGAGAAPKLTRMYMNLIRFLFRHKKFRVLSVAKANCFELFKGKYVAPDGKIVKARHVVDWGPRKAEKQKAARPAARSRLKRSQKLF